MSSIPRLYSQALFDLAPGSLEECLALAKTFDDQAVAFFNSSLINNEKKMKVLKALPLSETMRGFLQQLTMNRRWPFFQSIVKEYQRLVDKKENRLRGILYTSQKISDSEREKIEKSLSQFFSGQKVLLQVKTRENLIHGIRVEAGGLSFDDSLIHHLKQFKAFCYEKWDS